MEMHSDIEKRIEDSHSDEIEGLEEGELNAPLQQKINLDKADRSLSELQRWFTDGDLIIDPEWQRNYVWNRKQASKLIESFLLDIPIPVIYLARTTDNKYEVIDGLQRLKSVFDFLGNEISLSGLDILTDLNGKNYKSLDESMQRKLKNATLRSFELASDTESDIHFVVFERLNTGGTKLNEMEIRNCIYRGRLNNLTKELSGNPDFVMCMDQDSLSRRMRDRAFVLRFLAFYERTHLKYRPQGLKKFLNEFFDTYQDANDSKLNEYREKFGHCMKLSLSVFGKNGFRLKQEPARSSYWANNVNASVFQAVATSFADYDKGSITRNADSIYEEYVDLITFDRQWVDYVRRATGDAHRIAYVFDTWRGRLKRVMAERVQDDDTRLFSQRLKRQLLGQDDTCSICRQKIRVLEDAALDHEIHYWRGGKTVPENAQLVHRHCNFSKGGG